MFITFYWVAKNGKFPEDKWRFDKTNPHYCSVVLSKTNVVLVDLLQIKDKFHCQESIIIHGVSAYERVSAHGNVQIQSVTGR